MENFLKTQPGERTKTLESFIQYSESEVEKLLSMYKDYMTTQIEIEEINSQKNKPVQKFSFFTSTTGGKYTNLSQTADLEKKLESIGNKMKFQNPLI
jgi:hypothetical protein